MTEGENHFYKITLPFDYKNKEEFQMKLVDYPEMGLKLKQGCGRLIRTKDDRGDSYNGARNRCPMGKGGYGYTAPKS